MCQNFREAFVGGPCALSHRSKQITSKGSTHTYVYIHDRLSIGRKGLRTDESTGTSLKASFVNGTIK